MKKVTVLWYRWYDDLTGEYYETYRVFGSRKVAERFAEYIKYNNPCSEIEVVTCSVE